MSKENFNTVTYRAKIIYKKLLYINPYYIFHKWCYLIDNIRFTLSINNVIIVFVNLISTNLFLHGVTALTEFDRFHYKYISSVSKGL